MFTYDFVPLSKSSGGTKSATDDRTTCFTGFWLGCLLLFGWVGMVVYVGRLPLICLVDSIWIGWIGLIWLGLVPDQQ